MDRLLMRTQCTHPPFLWIYIVYIYCAWHTTLLRVNGMGWSEQNCEHPHSLSRVSLLHVGDPSDSALWKRSQTTLDRGDPNCAVLYKITQEFVWMGSSPLVLFLLWRVYSLPPLKHVLHEEDRTPCTVWLGALRTILNALQWSVSTLPASCSASLLSSSPSWLPLVTHC